jgi:hypothetical protein
MEITQEQIAEIRAQLARDAVGLDQEQAKRAAEFQAQVDRALGKKRVPITAAELKAQQNRYMFSSCLPGRMMPALAFGEKYLENPAYIPIERRIALA